MIPRVDLDLELVPPDQPGWSRRPDLVVVNQAAVERVDREGGLLRASEVLVACQLAGEFGYQDSETSGVFTTTEPCAVRLQLDLLR